MREQEMEERAARRYLGHQLSGGPSQAGLCKRLEPWRKELIQEEYFWFVPGFYIPMSAWKERKAIEAGEGFWVCKEGEILPVPRLA